MSGLPFLIIGLLAIFFADPWRRINAALEEQFGWTRGPAHETGLAFYRSRYAVWLIRGVGVVLVISSLAAYFF